MWGTKKARSVAGEVIHCRCNLQISYANAKHLMCV